MRIALQDSTLDPAMNLAIEQALVESTDFDLFLLWRDAPSIIIGRNQNAHREVDVAYAEQNRLPVVRRLSGGGAVYHDPGNLCFTFITDGGGRFGNHASFMAPVADVLRGMGVPAVLEGRNDISAEGRKVSGNAQYALGNRLCHHGTLLFNADLSVLRQALRPDPRKMIDKGVASTAARVANLAPYLPGMSCEGFMAALHDRMLRGPGAQDFSIDDSILARAEATAESRYRRWEWNWGSAPSYRYRYEGRFPGGSVELTMEVSAGIIEKAALYGDFLALRDVRPLIDVLIGCPHEKSAIAGAIGDKASLLGSISREELLSLF